MIEPSLQLGGGNWANKSDKLLGYHKDGANFYADELTFSRNSLGSYTDANGLVQTMPYNLLTYSEQFDNAAWTKSNATISANSTTAPNGNATADKLIENTVNNNHYAAQNVTAENIAYTYSLYVKADTRTRVRVQMSDLTTGDIRLDYNFTTDTSVLNGSGSRGSWSSSSFTKTDILGGWVRISISGIKGAGSVASCSVFLLDNSGNSSYTGNGTSGAFIWGAQLNQGSTALPYFPTTTRLNLARVDYKDNVNGSLLLEPQRTNLLTYSEDFSNASWAIVGSGMTKTINYALSPNNDLTACRITTTTSGSAFYSNIGTVSGVHTRSLWVKSNNGASQTILFENGDSVTATTSWQRVESITNGSAIFPIQLSGANLDILIWKPQCELGSYSTSYIKSEGAATTRLQDSCSMTGISDKIGQTEGTLFVEADLTHSAASNGYLTQVRGNNSNRFFIFRDGATNKLGCYALVNATQIYTTLTTAVATGTIKAAFAYKSGSFAFYVNGVQVGTSSAPYTISTNLTEFFIDQNNGLENGFYNYNQAQLFKTRLTNAELATLTTL